MNSIAPINNLTIVLDESTPILDENDKVNVESYVCPKQGSNLESYSHWHLLLYPRSAILALCLIFATFHYTTTILSFLRTSIF